MSPLYTTDGCTPFSSAIQMKNLRFGGWKWKIILNKNRTSLNFVVGQLSHNIMFLGIIPSMGVHKPSWYSSGEQHTIYGTRKLYYPSTYNSLITSLSLSLEMLVCVARLQSSGWSEAVNRPSGDTIREDTDQSRSTSAHTVPSLPPSDDQQEVQVSSNALIPCQPSCTLQPAKQSPWTPQDAIKSVIYHLKQMQFQCQPIHVVE